MNVTVYTTTALIEHTEVDRVEEHGSFLCIYEGTSVYKYNIAFVTHIVEDYDNPNKDLHL